jgi:DNA helicase-2/ATP-dependent DNA helicase PcrA
LNSSLAQIWRDNSNYIGASDAVQSAITQEHFATSTRVWNGVCVMTIHKAKGKEFDEVVVYEGLYGGRIVVGNDFDRAKLNLRVAVTRAKNNVVIFTPRTDCCPLL